jgi:imidazolonepropionase-like amidohydrolase
MYFIQRPTSGKGAPMQGSQNRADPNRRTVFANGLIFDGTGSSPVPGEVVVRGDRIESVSIGTAIERSPDDRVVECRGATVMPGLIEAHSHLTFPSAVGNIDTRFNPPLDVSFFRELPTPDEHLAIARRNARILLEAGFTSAYSAGSLTPTPVEVRLRDEINGGLTDGPRLRAASFERANNPVQIGSDPEPAKAPGPEGVREFIRQQAAAGFDSVKFLLSNDDVYMEGGSQLTQYDQVEVAAAQEQANESGVWLNCHAQSAESVKLAARNGFRAIYHCSYADEEAVDLLEEHKDEVFLAPAVGIIWANVHEGEPFGMDRAVAEQMGSVACLAAMEALYPELRRRGLRVLIGGDYGFPNNPIGRNARDLGLFVRLFGYSPTEALRAATCFGGQLMGMGDELGLLAPGYLADVLVVRGDPTQDVSLLEDKDNVLAVMKGGTFYTYDERLQEDFQLAGR